MSKHWGTRGIVESRWRQRESEREGRKGRPPSSFLLPPASSSSVGNSKRSDRVLGGESEESCNVVQADPNAVYLFACCFLFYVFFFYETQNKKQ
jgi:hypothetical protein